MVGLCMAPLAALAQEAEPAAPAAPATPAPEAQATPAPQNATEPPSAWIKVCNTNAETKAEICIMTQELRAETGRPIAAVHIQSGAEAGKYGIGVMVPPGFIIPPGVTLTVDGQKKGAAQFVICIPQSQQQPATCIAQATVDQNFINALKAGNKLSLVVVNSQNKPIPIDMTLAGFSKTFDGPGLDRAAAEAKRQQLSEALQKNALEARKKLIEQQQKEKENSSN
jgi:invasion protein IalB